MQSIFTEVSKMISLSEGLIGSAVWGSGPYAAAKFYELEAKKEKDPEKKKKLLHKARQLKLMAIGGAVGGITPIGGVVGGPIGAKIGYDIGRPNE